MSSSYQLYEVKVWVPAEDGLFPHPKLTVLTNMFDFDGDRSTLRMGDVVAKFWSDGYGRVFWGNGICVCKILRPIDKSRSMERDREQHGWQFADNANE